MQQDSDGALRAAQDRGDLGGGHLVDEPQDDGPAAILGQPGNGLPGRTDGLASRRGIDHVVRGRELGRIFERGDRPATIATPLVGNHVAGDPEEPDAERGEVRRVGRRRTSPSREAMNASTRSSKRGRPASACMKTRSVASSAAW